MLLSFQPRPGCKVARTVGSAGNLLSCMFLYIICIVVL